MGVFEAVCENPNEYGRFQRNARNVNDLASSNFCRRLRPFASVCRFFQRNVTRNDTRRGGLQRELRRVSAEVPPPKSTEMRLTIGTTVVIAAVSSSEVRFLRIRPRQVLYGFLAVAVTAVMITRWKLVNGGVPLSVTCSMAWIVWPLVASCGT